MVAVKKGAYGAEDNYFRKQVVNAVVDEGDVHIRFMKSEYSSQGRSR